MKKMEICVQEKLRFELVKLDINDIITFTLDDKQIVLKRIK